MNKFIFTGNIAYWHHEGLILNAMSLLFIGYKIAIVFRIVRSVDLLMQTIERVTNIIIKNDIGNAST